MKNNTKTNEDQWLRYFLWAVAFVLLIMGITFWIVTKYVGSWEKRGQFGDLFGCVNALFSGLAFAGLIITIRQQHKDLENQREAIKQTNAEMESQTAEFERQNETMKQERFEDTFFKLLDMHKNIVDDLYAADSHKETVREDNPNELGPTSKEVLSRDEYKGRNLFYYVFRRCPHYVGSIDIRKGRVLGLEGVIQEVGMSYFDEFHTTTAFDHYFRHLYTILKFVTENKWLGEEKQYQYATFVRATLSRYELVMLYYNGFFHPKMKKMIEKYCMLNNLRKDLLPMSLEYKNYLQGLRMSDNDIESMPFSQGDFEYYLTGSNSDDKKYNLAAFYTPEEMHIGIKLLNEWNKFIAEKSPIEYSK